jgi:hypothetical protein
MTNIKIVFALLLTFTMFVTSCNSSQTVESKQNRSKQQTLTTNEYDSTVFEDVFQKLNSGDTLSAMTIYKFAKSVDTRADFYDLLEKFHKQDLFPKEYLSFEKAAESRLTSWLMYPTELDTIPSKIELLKQVEYLNSDTTFIYYVFKFKTEEPHWAAKDGWMVGVVGPYFKNSSPYDWPKGTFSKLTKISATTPEKEVAWVHKNVYQKNDK